MRSIKLSLVVPIMAFMLAAEIKAEPPAKVDTYGDPLPAGAIARLGTVRWRHADGASFVAFLPDGKTLLSAGGDATVRIWDVATGKELRRFSAASAQAGGIGIPQVRGIAFAVAVEEFDSSPRKVALSADGKLMAMVDMNNAVRLYDVAACKEVKQIPFKDDAPNLVALSGDGKTLAISYHSGLIRLYDTTTGKESKTLGKKIDPNKPQMISGLALAPDGKTLGVANWTEESNAELTLYEASTGKELSHIKGKNRTPEFGGLEFSPDGKLLAWIGHNGQIVLAEPGTAKEVRRLKFGFISRSFGGFTIAPDSKTIVGWEQGSGEFHVWEMATGKHVRSLKGRGVTGRVVDFGEPSGASVSPDGKRLTWAGAGPILIVDMEKGTEVARDDTHRRPISRVSFGRDGKQIITADEGWHIRSWEADSGKAGKTISTPRRAMPLTLSEDGQFLATLGPRATLRLHETATGKEVRSITTGMDGSGVQPVLSRDNKRLVVAGMKGGKAALTVYDATEGKELHQLTVPPPVADSEDVPAGIALPVMLPRLILFSPDGRTLAALLDARRIALWDVIRGRELPMIEGPKDHGIQSVTFSPDGKSLVVDCDDFMPRLYEVATGHERSHYETKQAGTSAPQFLAPPPPPIFAGIAIDGEMMGATQGDVAISPDGRLLVHSRQGGAIEVWNVATRKELGQLLGHQAQVTSLTFSSDGKVLASGSRDTTALLWDMTKFLEAAKPQTAKVDAAARWADLLGTDAARAFDAICSFATTPAESVAFFKERARPAAPADAERVERLIANLDSPRFAERKNASGELEKLGESAIPLLRKALEGDPSPEARKRIEELLKKTDSAAPRGELLRSLRVVEVLETIATPEAKAILQTLSKGTAEAALTRSAQAALDRLAR